MQHVQQIGHDQQPQHNFPVPACPGPPHQPCDRCRSQRCADVHAAFVDEKNEFGNDAVIDRDSLRIESEVGAEYRVRSISDH